MSIYAISWVLQHSEAEKVDRLVLIALADYANDDGGGAWPSVANIGKKSRVSSRSVQYSLRRLEENGHIEKSGVTPKGTNVYRILMGGANAAPPAKKDQEGAQKTEGGAQDDVVGVQGAAPNPSLDPPLESSEEPPVKVRIEKAFEKWQSIIDEGVNAKAYKLTKERKRALKQRLEDSEPQEILDAMLGAWHDPWCQDKGKWDIAYCLRSRTLLEDFRDRRHNQIARANGASSNGNGHVAPSAHPEYDTTWKNPVVEAIKLIDANGPRTANEIAQALDQELEPTREMLMQMVEDSDCVYEAATGSAGEGTYARPGEAM